MERVLAFCVHTHYTHIEKERKLEFLVQVSDN